MKYCGVSAKNRKKIPSGARSNIVPPIIKVAFFDFSSDEVAILTILKIRNPTIATLNARMKNRNRNIPETI